MTSNNMYFLNKINHNREIRKNLVCTTHLVKNGFKHVFVSDKVLIRKRKMYVEKCYLTPILLKLIIIIIDNNKIFASSYLLESSYF